MTRMRVLVTGAGKRLGAAIARAVAERGHEPVIHYRRSREAATALARELDGVAVEGDLSDAADVPALFARACAGGPVDGLVNSASLFEYDSPSAIDPALAARLHTVNVVAPALLTAE